VNTHFCGGWADRVFSNDPDAGTGRAHVPFDATSSAHPCESTHLVAVLPITPAQAFDRIP
jgi:hypothetical protein